MSSLDANDIETQVRTKRADWRALVSSDSVQDGRVLLQQLLRGPIRFWPTEPQRAFRFVGQLVLGPLFEGVVHHGVASVMPASWNQIASWLQQVEGLRRVA